MSENRGDIFSQFLHWIGIEWKSKGQWFFWRSVLHFLGGQGIGWATFWNGYIFAIVGGILTVVIFIKEHRERDHQPNYKNALDPVIWVLSFSSVWVITRLF